MAGPWERFARQPQPQAEGPWTKFGAGLSAPVAPPSVPEMSWGETGADVAKSAGIGVAQGVLGLGTLPGNMEQLGRMGINKGAEWLGYGPQVSNDAVLPTYGDAKPAVENMVGQKFYEPKSTAGEYARTVGEFAPMAAMPMGAVGVGGRVMSAVAPAVVSETAGQLTKGTELEPYARIAGAMVGPRAFSPMPMDAVRQGHINRLNQEGVTALTAGQRTGSKPLKWMEASSQDTMFAGTRAARMQDQQAAQFTRAALRHAGVDAERATPQVIDGAFTQLGQQFDALAARNTVPLTRRLTHDMGQAVVGYERLVGPNARAPGVAEAVQDVVTMAQQNGGRLPGATYGAIRSRLERMRRQSIADPQLSGVFGDLRNALDDAMERSAGPADAAAFRQARTQYRHLLGIEKAMGGAGERIADGFISPAHLKSAMKQQNKRAHARGQDDLGELARSGVSAMSPLPQSGTAPRMAMRTLFSGVGAAAGGAVANVPGAVAGAMVPAIAEGMFGRAIMSPLVQRYLANQMAAGGADRPALMNAMRAYQAAASQNDGLVGRQTRGVYPPGDPRWLEEDQ